MIEPELIITIEPKHVYISKDLIHEYLITHGWNHINQGHQSESYINPKIITGNIILSEMKSLQGIVDLISKCEGRYSYEVYRDMTK